MLTTKNLFLALLISGTCFSPAIKGQPSAVQASLKISGEVGMPLALKVSDLQQFKQTGVTRKDKDGKDYSYTGVLLADVLQKAGVTLGKDLRGKNLTKYVLIDASDGYQVVFALAELDPDFSDKKIIIATGVDGKPLDANQGPFRIIVQNENKPARCIKQVIAMAVHSAK